MTAQLPTDEKITADVLDAFALDARMGVDPVKTIEGWECRSRGYKIVKDCAGGRRLMWRGVVYDNRYPTLSAAQNAAKLLAYTYHRRAEIGRDILADVRRRAENGRDVLVMSAAP